MSTGRRREAPPGVGVVLACALACYALAQLALAYLVGFVGNVGVPGSIDSGPAGATASALAVDLGLVALFGLQHSVMARPGAKARLLRVVPAALERAVYVAASAAALLAIFALWRPLPEPVWSVAHPAARAALWGLFVGGWGVAVAATFAIDHFELFGLRQAWRHRRAEPHVPAPFQTPALYRMVRHPMQLGTLLGLWATPAMSRGHLLFAGAMTVYVLVGLRLEERDLVRTFGDRYRAYQARVPMLIPRWPRLRERG